MNVLTESCRVSFGYIFLGFGRDLDQQYCVSEMDASLLLG
jgi:hypothetical protein